MAGTPAAGRGWGCVISSVRASTTVSQNGEPKPFLVVLTKNPAPVVEPKMELKNGGCTVISQNHWNIADHCYQPNV